MSLFEAMRLLLFACIVMVVQAESGWLKRLRAIARRGPGQGCDYQGQHYAVGDVIGKKLLIICLN